MRRREFIGLLGGVAGALTCADVFAAQKLPMARIGFLRTGPLPTIECCADPECKSPRGDPYQNPKCPLIADLQALGWREGENLHVEARFDNSDPASLPRLAAELVALRPDILVAGATIETKAFQAATSDIPIVFLVSTDPVGSGQPCPPGKKRYWNVTNPTNPLGQTARANSGVHRPSAHQSHLVGLSWRHKRQTQSGGRDGSRGTNGRQGG